MTNVSFYCEADKEYWKHLKETRHERQHDTIVYRRCLTPIYPGELYWIIDGRMTTKGLIDKYTIWHGLKQVPPRYYSKLQGNRALDICSSYGISSRELCEGHKEVHILEFEDWYARIVEVNVKGWGYKDRISVAVERDFTRINYAAYDSVRFGLKSIEYLFYKNPQELMKVKTIAFDFDVNPMIVQALLEEGYCKSLHYSGCAVFTKV